MDAVNISSAEAIDLARDSKILVTELEALGFTIVTGDVQVAAVAVTTTVAPNAELVAHAEALFEAGRETDPTKSGRERRLLSEKDGLSPYRLSITKE